MIEDQVGNRLVASNRGNLFCVLADKAKNLAAKIAQVSSGEGREQGWCHCDA